MDYDWRWFWVWRYREALWNGLVVTVELNFVVLVISTIIGMLVGLARLSKFRTLRAISWFYVDLFRTVPLLVLIFWFYFAFPLLSKKYLTLGSFTAAVVALSLNFSAFIAEIFRAGIQSVPKHQIEAARSLVPFPVSQFRVVHMI